MKDFNYKQTLGALMITAILCVLFIFSSFIGEIVYSEVNAKPEVFYMTDTIKVEVPSGRDTVYFDMCSSCVHFETCIKCQAYEKELSKGGFTP